MPVSGFQDTSLHYAEVWKTAEDSSSYNMGWLSRCK